jgi:hypothetical protein
VCGFDFYLTGGRRECDRKIDSPNIEHFSILFIIIFIYKNIKCDKNSYQFVTLFVVTVC